LAEQHGGRVDSIGFVEVSDRGQVFDSVGQAYFLGRELEGLEAEVVGLVKVLGVGRGGDDGDVVATVGEELGYVA